MAIWSAEIRELEQLYESIKGQLPELEKELVHLIKSEDENVIMLYSRRCLEVIITDLCECELKRERGTEPLKGIIDKLHKEKKIPAHIVSSMYGLNELSTYGTHPKDFDPEQVKPVLVNLDIIIKWYLKYKNIVTVYENKVDEEKIQPRKEPLQEVIIKERTEVQEKPAEAGERKLISIVTISAILVIAAILAYPKIFKRDTLEKLRSSGERISIAVMPFENLTGDTTINWFQRGISSLLINGLGSSSELAVLDDQTMYEAMERMRQVYTAALSPLKATKLSKKAKTETYISGSFQGTEGKYKILANLVDTKSGEIICTKMAEGDLKSSAYLDLADSLCNEIKDHLEIKVLERKTDYDFREVFPNSAEAYRYFVEGVNLMLNSDYEAATKSIEKSLKIDSTFTFASFYLAFANSFNDQYEQAIFWTQKAYKSKEKLPIKYQNWLEMWYAFYLSESKRDILYYCNLLEKSGIESRLLWFDLGCTYREVLRQFDRSVKAFKKIEEINAENHSDWKYIRYYEEFCLSLLNNNMPEEAIKISIKGLNFNPENIHLIIYKGSGYCMLRDSLSLNKVIQGIRAYITTNKKSKSLEETYLGDIYRNAKDYENAIEHYRRSYLLEPEKSLYLLFNYSQSLIEQEINVEEGLKISEIIINNYPEMFWGIYLKGLAYLKMGRNEEALEILKEADQKCQGYYAPLAESIQEVENALTKNQ